MTELAHRRPQSVADHATVDYTAALAYLGLRANDPKAHALILVCQRYQLDPLLGHVSIYKDRPYIHFAGYLHLANAHPQFAGLETVREWEDERYCYATVRAHRGDRDFPAERTGKSLKAKPKQGGGTYDDADADAKAFAQAARRALRMAFNVDHPDPAEDEGAGPVAAPAPVVEVARRVVEQTTGAVAPSPPAGQAAPVPNASVTGPGDTDVPAGHEPPNAEATTSPPPASLGDGDDKAGRGRRRGPGKAAASAPPAGPTHDEQAEQAAFDQGLADDTDPGEFAR